MFPKSVLRPNSGKYVFQWEFTDDFSIKDTDDTKQMVEFLCCLFRLIRCKNIL